MTERCECCEESPRAIRINVTTLDGTLLDQKEVCRDCASDPDLGYGFDIGTASLPSEMIEPALAQAVGLIFDEWERSTKDEMAARRLYYNVRGLSRFTLCNNRDGTGVHAQIAMNNHVTGVAGLIEEALPDPRGLVAKDSRPTNRYRGHKGGST